MIGKQIPSDRADAELSVREAAALTGIPERTTYKHIKKGRLPAERRGGRKIIPPEGQEALRQLQANRQRVESARDFAQVLEEKRGISHEAAMKRIKRWRDNKGLGDREIEEKIARECGFLPDETEES
jgi:excisionase family DNA binding protein